MRHLPSLPALPLGRRSWRTWLCRCCWTPPASLPSWLWPPYRQTCAQTTSSQVSVLLPALPACAAHIYGRHSGTCSTRRQPLPAAIDRLAPSPPAPPRPPAVCTALSAICHIVSPELVGVFLPQVTALLRHDRDLVKKKALLAMHRFIQVDPAVAPDVERHLIDKIGYKVGGAVAAASVCGGGGAGGVGWGGGLLNGLAACAGAAVQGCQRPPGQLAIATFNPGLKPGA
jgi:hypothetical protein